MKCFLCFVGMVVIRLRGITDIQRLIWISSRPLWSSQVKKMMQSISGVGFEISEQQKDDGKSRTERYNIDIRIFVRYLFILWSLSAGLTANQKCNVHNSIVFEEKNQESRIGKAVQDHVLKQKEGYRIVNDSEDWIIRYY